MHSNNVYEEISLDKYVVNNELHVFVKPNSRENKILGYGEEKKAVMISISEPAEDNKANKELIKFVSKLLKKRVLIKSGKGSRMKVLKVY